MSGPEECVRWSHTADEVIAEMNGYASYPDELTGQAGFRIAAKTALDLWESFGRYSRFRQNRKRYEWVELQEESIISLGL